MLCTSLHMSIYDFFFFFEIMSMYEFGVHKY